MHLRKQAPAMGLAAALVLFMLVRLPLLRAPGVFQGWTSDAAILGLMAKKIVDGRGFDFYFWGQNFIGPLTSIVAAAIGFVRGVIGLSPQVAPIALRLATLLLVAGGIVVLWDAIRRTSVAAATATATFLAIGPPVLLLASVVARSTDAVFFLGAGVTWFGSRYLAQSPQRRHWVMFGVLCGFSWWMNQQVFFFVAGVLWLAIRKTGWLSVQQVRTRRRLLFEYNGFTSSQRALLIVAESLLVLQIAYIVFRSFTGWPAPVPGFRWPLGEPIVALIVLHLAAAAWQRDPILTAIRWRKVANVALLIACGFVLGYAPVLVGRALNWVEPGYFFGTQLNYPPELLAALAGIFTRVFPMIFGSAAAAAIAAVLIMMWLTKGRAELSPVAEILVITAAANLVYAVLAERPPFRPWYFIASVPAAWTLTSFALTDLAQRTGKMFAAAAAVVLVAVLGSSSLWMIQELRAEPDPRLVISHLKAANCRVVYAEYWTAYKYRFLTNEEILFIVYQSQDRSPEDSAAFAKAPGLRCLLEPNGRIKLMNELPAVPDVVGEDVLPKPVR